MSSQCYFKVNLFTVNELHARLKSTWHSTGMRTFPDTIKTIFRGTPVLCHAVLIISSSPPWWGRDSRPRVTGMAAHMDGGWVVTYTHSLGRGSQRTHHAGTHGCAPGSRASGQVAGGSSVATRAWRTPSSHRRMRRASLNDPAAWQGVGTCYSGRSSPLAWSAGRGGLFAGGTLPTGAECRGELAVRLSEALPASHVT